MFDLIWLSEVRVHRVDPHFLLSNGVTGCRQWS